ncbi:hypothetical protein O181_042075 [Austropuccinia psidii MF-1]|uniref:Uncharacterized protein n=1 Tax=Austropuccinia psidii MF-1 TaxID=1389203 RepID=A0A9Q3HHT1_9BASI|nr:hypothetical protein [Austropuccinia psidii MF-1]
MPVKHSPPERQTRSQARAQAVLTPTPRVPLVSTPAVPQLRAQLDRGPYLEVAAPSRMEGRGPRRSNSLFRSCTGGPTLSQSNQPASHLYEPSSLGIMHKMTQIMANLQSASSSEASRPPAFKTPSMKALEFFDGTQPFKVRSFIQSFQLIFHSDLENFSQDRNK